MAALMVLRCSRCAVAHSRNANQQSILDTRLSILLQVSPNPPNIEGAFERLALFILLQDLGS
ncbi:unnamed protein product [Fusarium graminearum]|uniref:Chromosome 2, complete genome n=1 Tax=Gibberella zeae (strain ATCC MYA-4620 / CBS 123657 / FGSC 9075 / NRRL 31084 / PH-1) TaxID=229533 RepID=A0A098DFS2_GIBZE|nr:unnamed protein product [Fusarium graminearum]